jgi:hypothetical protein
MRPKRNRKSESKPTKTKQSPSNVGLEWRRELGIYDTHNIDIRSILTRPTTEFPYITICVFDASKYPKLRVSGWANTETRTVNISSGVESGLLYGDPRSRWRAAHECGHIALNHPGNNLLMGRPYTYEDREREKEAEEFAYEFLAPFHLAQNLRTVDQYERRFCIPREKAIARKRQVDEIKRRASLLMNNNIEGEKAAAPKKINDSASPQVYREQLSFAFIFSLGSAVTLNREKSTTTCPGGSTGGDTIVTGAKYHNEIAKQQPETPGIALQLFSSEDDELMEALIRDVNIRVKKYRRRTKLFVGTLVALIGALPIMTESGNETIRLSALTTSGLIGATLAFFQFLDRPIGLGSQYEAIAWRILNKTAEDRGAKRKLAKFDIAFKYNRFVIQRIRKVD